MSEQDGKQSPYLSYPDAGFDESKAPDITAWKLARSGIEHENNLVNHRLTWFYSSQAFLMAAFLIVASNSDKPIIQKLDELGLLYIPFLVIGLLAIYVCGVTQDGVKRANIALDNITRHYNELADLHNFSRTPPLHYWESPTFFDSRNVPLFAAVAWVVLVSVLVFAKIQSLQAFMAKVTIEHVMVAFGLAVVVFGSVAVGYNLALVKNKTDGHRGG